MQTVIKEVTARLTDGDREAIREGAAILRRGGLVIFPTETVYGLGGNGLSADAARAIYEAKGRPSDNPLILHVAEPRDAETLAFVTPMFYKLADAFMPGPITVIMPARDVVPRTTTGGLSTVAIRCPSHPVANALIKECVFPIAAPSANLSGSPSPTCGAHVAEDMDGRVDMLLDGGDCDFGVESTIVKIEDDESLTLLRPGAVTIEDLRKITPNVRIADAVFASLKEGEKALSPGMKYKHYAPKTETCLLSGTPENVIRFLEKEAKNADIAVLTYDEDIRALSAFLPESRIIAFGSRSDTRTQAHRLFYLLREADKLAASRIYAPLPEKTGLGMALYNRMIRAAAHQIITL